MGFESNYQKILKKNNYEEISMPKPVAHYVRYVKSGNLIFISGQGPFYKDEAIFTGKIGKDRTKEEGYEAAKICALNALTILRDAIGNLDDVKRIVSVRGFVNSTDDFAEQPAVINGASDVFLKVFEDNGKHARCAISSNSLPADISVEVEVIIEI